MNEWKVKMFQKKAETLLTLEKGRNWTNFLQILFVFLFFLLRIGAKEQVRDHW